jgi:hypothetical protein
MPRRRRYSAIPSGCPRLGPVSQTKEPSVAKSYSRWVIFTTRVPGTGCWPRLMTWTFGSPPLSPPSSLTARRRLGSADKSRRPTNRSIWDKYSGLSGVSPSASASLCAAVTFARLRSFRANSGCCLIQAAEFGPDDAAIASTGSVGQKVGFRLGGAPPRAESVVLPVGQFCARVPRDLHNRHSPTLVVLRRLPHGFQNQPEPDGRLCIDFPGVCGPLPIVSTSMRFLHLWRGYIVDGPRLVMTGRRFSTLNCDFQFFIAHFLACFFFERTCPPLASPISAEEIARAPTAADRQIP